MDVSLAPPLLVSPVATNTLMLPTTITCPPPPSTQEHAHPAPHQQSHKPGCVLHDSQARGAAVQVGGSRGWGGVRAGAGVVRVVDAFLQRPAPAAVLSETGLALLGTERRRAVHEDLIKLDHDFGLAYSGAGGGAGGRGQQGGGAVAGKGRGGWLDGASLCFVSEECSTLHRRRPSHHASPACMLPAAPPRLAPAPRPCAVGVLCSRSGAVRALWSSYSDQVAKQETEWTAGSPAAVCAPWVELLIREHERRLQHQNQPQQAPPAPPPPAAAAADAGATPNGGGGVEAAPRGAEEAPAVLLPPPRVVTLDAELEPLLLSKAAQFGLPPEWVSRLFLRDPERRQVLRVRSCVAGSHAQKASPEGRHLLVAHAASVWRLSMPREGVGRGDTLCACAWQTRGTQSPPALLCC